LEKQIKWIENYSCRGNINRPSYVNEVKALKQELADLLKEDAKADKLRSLPLLLKKQEAHSLHLL